MKFPFEMEIINKMSSGILSLTDEQLKALFDTIGAEIDRRKDETRSNQKVYWEHFLKDWFPETQVGGKCKVGQYRRYISINEWYVDVVFKFTPAKKVTGLTHIRNPPYHARLARSFNEYSFSVEFDSGFPDSWFSYRTKNNGTSKLLPYAYNDSKYDRQFPPEVLELPWIAKILNEPHRIYATFLSADTKLNEF